MIKISHPFRFLLFMFPKLRLIKASWDENSKKFQCELTDEFVVSDFVFLLRLQGPKINKLDFRKASLKKTVTKINYPNKLIINSKPRLKVSKEIISNPIRIKKNTVVLNNMMPKGLLNNPIDVIISQNINLCQTHLNQQIQVCPNLDQ